ncbi:MULTISPECIES: ArsA family ATPase [unclassified Wenzhouxiangella]|uniref:ArsA family ATPase n=1 Tax=unclassified Wenzhouxiangella TaxID=2613841 RepID=UPI0015F24A31|nr:MULTISPECIES: ArsA family ATPase [unclassified Wenzhouxiangella]
MLLSDQPVVLVAGKGGVGKTTVSAALAVQAARAGHRTLVVSTDPAHSLGDVLQTTLGHEPSTVEAGLDAIEVDAERLAAEHVEQVARALRDYAHPDTWPDIDRHMALAHNAPGTVEAALIDWLAGLLDGVGRDYARIVLDTAPGGHTLRLLQLPESLGRWTDELLDQQQRHDRLNVERGHDESVSERSRRIADRLQRRQARLETVGRALTDAECCGALLVCSPERLPVLESVRLAGQLQQTGIEVAGCIVNGVFPDDDHDFIARRRKQQQRWIDELARQIPDLPLHELELRAESPTGPDELAELLTFLRPCRPRT